MSYGQELGYLAEMGSVDYPFINSDTPQQLRELFSDMVVTFDRTSLPSDIAHYLALSTDDWTNLTLDEWLGVGQNGEQYDIVLDTVNMSSSTFNFVLRYDDFNGSNGVLLDTTAGTTTVTSFDWGSNPTWRVYNFSGSKGVRIKCVVDVSKLVSYSASNLGLKVTSRCVEIRPTRLKSIKVYDTDTNTPYTFAVDDVKFAGGYNMVLDVDNSGVVEVDLATPQTINTERAVTYNCIPGKGLGRFKPDCTDNTYVRVINGVSADANGAFNLDARDCYWIEKLISFGGSPPGTNPRKGTTTLGTAVWHNDCQACVTCDDFYRAYQKLTQIHDRAQLLYNRVMSALKFYDYYRTLAETIKNFLNEPEGTFTVVKENASLFTVKVTLSAGKHDIDAFDATLLLPSGFNFVVKKGSGWRRIGSQTKIRPLDDTKTPMIDNHISYPITTPSTVYFGKNSVSFWQWSFYLRPVTDDPTTITTQSIQFGMNMTAHIAGGSSLNLGSFTHTTSITH